MVVIGIDIGGTKTIVAVADTNGDIIAESKIRTPREEGPGVVLNAIEQAIRVLLKEPACDGQIKSIGIGCGGPLDPEKGIILTAPNLPGWENLEISAYFEKAFEAPVYLDNDVTVAALGEARKGAGIGVDYLAYFNIGTGVGGGIIIAGKPYRGCGNAGEFGHQIILPDGPQCLCSRQGCLESLVSGTSIARRAKEHLSQYPDSSVLRYSGSIENITAEHVAQAARENDDIAMKIWEETGEFIGLGIANVINILNPRRVIIGGSIIKAADLYFETLKRTVNERAMTRLAQDAEILPAKLGDHAGIVGAIYLALEQL